MDTADPNVGGPATNVYVDAISASTTYTSSADLSANLTQQRHDHILRRLPPLPATKAQMTHRTEQFRPQSRQRHLLAVPSHEPIVPSSPSDITRRRRILRIADTHPLRLLLAEDNLVTQKIMCALLTRMGYTNFDVCIDGHQVIAQCQVRFAENDPITCILMDVQMDGLDGIECTRQLRRLPCGNSKSLYIIAQTAKVSAEWRQRCVDSGMNTYISKPIVLEHLQSQLKIAHDYLHK